MTENNCNFDSTVLKKCAEYSRLNQVVGSLLNEEAVYSNGSQH